MKVDGRGFKNMMKGVLESCEATYQKEASGGGHSVKPLAFHEGQKEMAEFVLELMTEYLQGAEDPQEIELVKGVKIKVGEWSL